MNGEMNGETERPWHHLRRRDEIAALAAGPAATPRRIEYSEVEHDVWRTVGRTLTPLWDRFAAPELLAARERLALPTDRIPQLFEVDAWLTELTDFGFRAVPGLVPIDEFFGALADRRFLSTQYVRWEGSPLYTPEPDVIHEVVGHAHCLACPQLAELHVLAGLAITRAESATTRQVLADVFWFSAEFGVITTPHGPSAYGAGLLSSCGELAWFAEHAETRPLDVVAMATLPYDIDHYQPVLFAADSLDHVLDTVGGFFATATDDSVAPLANASSQRAQVNG